MVRGHHETPKASIDYDRHEEKLPEELRVGCKFRVLELDVLEVVLRLSVFVFLISIFVLRVLVELAQGGRLLEVLSLLGHDRCKIALAMRIFGVVSIRVSNLPGAPLGLHFLRMERVD